MTEPTTQTVSETAFKSDFLRLMKARGYIHQITHPVELDEAAASGVVTGYIGFDATAPSLHVGHLIQIMLLRRLQQAGHKPIVLMGGGTTKVGDPSFKDTQRPLLTEEKIAENIAGIKGVFEKFLTFGDGPTDAVMLDNDEWLSQLGYLQFLRDYGTHFTINRMLSFDSVKLRLDREQPLTFLEFNYMLMQATDFLELNRRYGCVLQMGGSDQWGNIVNGVELTRRVDHKAAFGLTTPLLSTASGQKMGKTVGGAVWLNADALSPYEYWQYWRNTEDGDVGRFMRLFTDLPETEIARWEALEGAEINEAKKALADATTTMLHGAEAAASARARSEAEFERGEKVLLESYDFDWAGEDGFIRRTPEALVKAAGISSIKDAKRSIANGEIRINGMVVKGDETYGREDIHLDHGAFLVEKGKKIARLVRPI